MVSDTQQSTPNKGGLNGISDAVTGARVYLSMMTTKIAVAIIARRGGAATKKNHMAIVTWRDGGLAIWFTWKRQILNHLPLEISNFNFDLYIYML